MAEHAGRSIVKLATRDEVELFANAANVTDRIDPVQVLSFNENLNNSELKLVELPPEVVASFEAGEAVVFRGRPNDNLVLCTNSMSYEVQQADTSNLLLLSPDTVTVGGGPPANGKEDLIQAEVIGSFHETFEAKEFNPKYERIHFLLNKFPLKDIGPSPSSVNVYTFCDLLKESQASEQELLAYLHKIQALEVNGHWCILEYPLRDSILNQVLNLIEEKDWDWYGFPRLDCLEILSSLFPTFALEHVLSLYVKPIDDQSVSLNEEMVCVYHAECLLKPVIKFSYFEFLEIWQQAVPLGMQTKPSQLLTMSVRDMSSSSPSIWYFPEERLDSQPYDRLVQLFRVKERWTEDEIIPFLSSLETSKVSVNSIMLRFTRSSLDPTGTKYFSLRKTH